MVGRDEFLDLLRTDAAFREEVRRRLLSEMAQPRQVEWQVASALSDGFLTFRRLSH
jgi:hypothetical protein